MEEKRESLRETLERADEIGQRHVTNPQPDQETLEGWEADSGCEATDGCWVETDGTCEHGCRSWLLELGMI